MIIFRTDANPHIATGHLMRCLSIADECRQRGVPLCFVLADSDSERLMKRLCPVGEEYRIIVLESRYDAPTTEWPAFADVITREKPRAILIDSYFVTADYLAKASQLARTFYLDDLKAFDYPVDTVIHYGVEARPDFSGEGKKAHYLSGPAYAPLRGQFADVPYSVRAEVGDILITSGGSDEAGMCGRILAAVRATEATQTAVCHIVIGALNRHRESLRQQTADDPNIRLYEDFSEMASLMAQCDLAVSAAGSTIYELCAVGVPTVCFSAAANQVPNAVGLSARKAVVYAVDGLFEAHIAALAADLPRRRALSARMRSLVDGRGAARIAEELMEKT